MLPTKGNLVLLFFVLLCVVVTGLPFNAKYRFAREAVDENQLAEEEGSGSGFLDQRDGILNDSTALPAANATAPKDAAENKDSKANNKTSESAKPSEAASVEKGEDKAKEKVKEVAFGDGQALTSSEFAGKEAPKEASSTDKDASQDAKEANKELHNKSSIDETTEAESESEEAATDDEANENESEEEDSSEESDNEAPDNSDVKMFFISPFDRNSNEDPAQRQILTYPAKSHGWGHTHQFGPSHIWNSDYPYFAYGYSWGCGHHGYGPRGHVKKSNVNGKKDDNVCRDYVLVPAVNNAPAVLSPSEYETGVARNYVSKDIACNDGDSECAQRQVIGSMAGGSMFGDGMGGLGLGFPGVPGIHTGISGYNMAGGFGDHMGGGYGRVAGHGRVHGGHGRVHGGQGSFGNYGPSHFFKSDEHGISSYWNGRANIPGDVRGFFGASRPSTFFHGEDILPIHEASNGVGSGHSYGHGSAQWWDKTPGYHNYGIMNDFGDGHGDAYLGGPIHGGLGNGGGHAYGGGNVGAGYGSFGIGAGFADSGIGANGFGGDGGHGLAGNGLGLGYGGHRVGGYGFGGVGLLELELMELGLE